MEGLVRFGINNRYNVQHGAVVYECTLKGKKLDTGMSEYAALAPGDRVALQIVSEEHRHGVIEELLPRAGTFARWNNKKNRVQVFAANIDLVVCVASATSPEFHHRFIDRVLATAQWFGVDAAVVLNKIDLGVPESALEYLAWLDGIGYPIVYCSAESGSRMEKLQQLLTGRHSVFIGHSGVGKSSLVNRLIPGTDLPAKPISRKYGKGVHTTRYAQIIDYKEGGWMVDAPGIREIELIPDIRGSLDRCFPEFLPFLNQCKLPGCSHIHEPDCAVYDAVEQGHLPEFRYESYGMMYESLEERFSAT